MKVLPVLLAAEYAAAGSTLAVCMKVTRSDAVVVGFTSLNAPLTVSGVLYKPGFDPSAIVQSSGLAVDNLELTVLPDAPGGLAVDRYDLISGLWDNAAFQIFEVNWKSPTDGINVLKRGTMGQAQETRGSYTIELRGLKQALQQPVGAVTSKTCRYRLGDAGCTLNLATFTFAHTVTSVTSRHVFTCTAAAEASDYFGDGQVTCLTGLNAGYARKVKSFAAGVFTLAQEFPFTVAIGDTFSCAAGCRKRHGITTANPTGISDCKTKFNNVLNFGGEPHVPGNDALTTDPTTSTP